MARRLLTQRSGAADKWFAEEDGTYYRGYSIDTTSTISQVKRMAEEAPGRFGKKGDFYFEATMPREIIDDILRKLGKTWHDYATDVNLSEAVNVIFKQNYPKLTAKHWQV